MPERDLARLTSDALIDPFALRSVRKFAPVTVAPDCALTCEISEALTDLFPVESPESTFMLTAVLGKVWASVSVTPLRVTRNFLRVRNTSQVDRHCVCGERWTPGNAACARCHSSVAAHNVCYRM